VLIRHLLFRVLLFMLYCSVGNRLHNIPVEISRLRCLRSLDISNNKISVLPRELSDIQTLESVIVDVAQMRYPSSGVCMLLFLLVLGEAYLQVRPCIAGRHHGFFTHQLEALFYCCFDDPDLQVMC